MMKTAELNLVKEWDKVFPRSEKVDHQKVTFINHFGITLAADMYIPKNPEGKLPAIAVSGPFGACKEQSSRLYAQTMAEKGFLTIAFDPSFTGESGGFPRAVNSPDINVEDFQAAVACIDTRIKATVTSTMYDMSRVSGNGYFDSVDNEEARYQARISVNDQRTEDYKNGNYKRAGGVIDPLPDDAPYFVKDYHAYYKTPRGYHSRSLNSNDGWIASAGTSLMNTRLFTYAKEIRSAVLMIHGEKAHSCYFSKDAYEDMIKDSKYSANKELMIIPGASHTDLYDQTDIIPFDKIEAFIRSNI